MIDTSKLSDEVIPGLQEVYANYGQVLPAGVYRVTLGDTTHIKFYRGTNAKGKPYTSVNGMTFKVAGDRNGNTDGVPVGATLRFQKAWIENIVNAVFTKSQIASGEGIPVSERAQGDFLNTLAENATQFTVKVDWDAFDTFAYNEVLVALTKTKDREDPIAMARQLASDDQTDEASAAATLAETYADFPLNEEADDGSRLSFIVTEDEREVRAQANVIRYFLAQGAATPATPDTE